MRMRDMGTLRQVVVVGVLAVLASGPVQAVDGVIEINQARAKAGGVTPGDTPLFPVTISQPGSYRLTGNLDVTDASARPGSTLAQNTTAIEVTVNDVTVDLNGFVILGRNAVGTGKGIDANNKSNITVVNGTVRGMGSIGVEVGFHCSVEKLHVSNSGSDGIFAGGQSLLSGNTTAQNLDDGIFCFSECVVSGNIAFNNDKRGIRVRQGGAVLGNSVIANNGFGLDLGADTGYGQNVLRGNLAGTVCGGGVQIPAASNLCNGSTACPSAACP